MSKRSFGLFSLMVTGLFVLSACADPQQPTATTTIFEPTPGGAPPVATSPSGATAVPRPTAAPVVPDAAAGAVAFTTNCVFCHNTSSDRLVGPGLAGIGDRAGSTVPGLSADDYIRMSIKDPGSFVVDGFGPVSAMPQLTQLTDQDIENLVAYLKTLQ